MMSRQQASIPVTNRIEALLTAGQLFETEQIPLRDLAVHRPSLDDVFLSITGKLAERDDPEVETAAGRGGRRR